MFTNVICGTENCQTCLCFYYEETFCSCILNLKVVFRKDFENEHAETITKLKDLGKKRT